jgi:hypothetical protein
MVMGDFGAAHRKVRKDRKSQPQCGTQMTRIGRISTDPCKSASSAQSAFHHVCLSLKTKASGASVSALIRVHLRFFKNVIFQTGLTGLTGYVFNSVHPVVLSNLKCHVPAPQFTAKVRMVG